MWPEAHQSAPSRDTHRAILVSPFRTLAVMSANLRILVVTVVHDPEDARIRYRQIPALQDAGHRVAYAAPFTAFARTPPAGVRPYDLPRARGRRRMQAVIAARNLIARVGPMVDVVLMHDPDLLLAIVGQRRWVGPVVWDVHENTAAALSMRPWVPAAMRPGLGMAVRLAERVAESTSHILLAESGYRERFRSEHPVVPNAVQVPRQQPPIPGDSRVVYLGKLTRSRGAREVIELARRVPEVQVEVIGPAESDVAPELERACREGTLHWTGFLPNDEALRRLPGALAGVSLLHDEPNYHYSPPTKIMEYMAHGLPVITTPNPASRALIDESGGGAVVPFRDVTRSAQILRNWIADVEERVLLGARAYEYARSCLDWSVHAIHFVDTIEELASSDARNNCRKTLRSCLANSVEDVLR